MAESLALKEVTSRERLQAYLLALPSDQIKPTSQIIAFRMAFWTLPYVVKKEYDFKVNDDLIKSTISNLRCVLTSRVAIHTPSISISNAATLYVATAPRDSNISKAAVAAAHIASSAYNSTAVNVAVASSAAYANELVSNFGHIWDEVQTDLRLVALSESATILLSVAIFFKDDPNWQFQCDLFRRNLYSLSSVVSSERYLTWLVWWEWYEPQIFGGIPWSLPVETSKQIEKRIALGDNREDFWDRDPHVITQEIAGWVREARAAVSTYKPQVFISYSERDIETAKLVSSIIEQETDYRSFAQFKDIPPGSNFISEMQKGLENMALFSPLYSPDYVNSKMCEAEWNAAFLADPTGDKRSFRAFLLDATTTLKPLHRPIVWVPLFELTESKLREAIRDTFMPLGYKRSAAQSRQDAKDANSPTPTINEQGLLDSQIHDGDLPVLTDEIAGLPKSLRRSLSDLLSVLAPSNSNCPPMLRAKLDSYLEDLLENGARPNIVDLKHAVAIVANIISEGKSEDASWLSNGVAASLDQFIEIHQKFIQHFPLRMLDDLKVEQSPIDHDKINDPQLIAAYKAALDDMDALQRDGLSTVRPGKLLASREQQRRDLLSLPSENVNAEKPLIHQPGKITKAELEKRWLWVTSGYFDKLLDTIAKVTSIADSESGKALIKHVKDYLGRFW